MLLASDVPNKVQLQHAVTRLIKDYEMLSRIKGRNDSEEPKAIIAAASFLDMLVRRESRNLEKGELAADVHLSSLQERFTTYILSLPNEESHILLNSIKEKLEQQV